MTGYRVSNSTSTGCFSVSLDFVATFKSLARWRIWIQTVWVQNM